MRRQLVVQSADASLFGCIADVDLSDARSKMLYGEFSSTPGTRKKTTVIIAAVEVDKKRASHFGFRKVHRIRIKKLPRLARDQRTSSRGELRACTICRSKPSELIPS